jgi:ribosomal protein L11 methyltransferase
MKIVDCGRWHDICHRVTKLQILSTMTKLYLSLRYVLPEEHFENAYTALAHVQHLGIAEAHDEITICLLHDGSADFQTHEEERLQSLFAQFNVPVKFIESLIIKEENWNKEWEESIEPVRVNERIVITPSWKEDTVSAPLKIVINPQMSFGTGHHETTRMVANLLESSVTQGDFWVDAGTGTGVLAILALRCGASRVYAFDNDEWSVLNTQENVERNGISVHSGEDPSIVIEQNDINTMNFPSCNGITANLHKNLLLNNMDKFFQALKDTKGILIVSGLLKYDSENVITCAKMNGFSHILTSNEGEWIAIKFTVS